MKVSSRSMRNVMSAVNPNHSVFAFRVFISFEYISLSAVPDGRACLGPIASRDVFP